MLLTTSGQVQHGDTDTDSVQLDQLDDQAVQTQQPGLIVDHAGSYLRVTIRPRGLENHTQGIRIPAEPNRARLATIGQNFESGVCQASEFVRIPPPPPPDAVPESPSSLHYETI